MKRILRLHAAFLFPFKLRKIQPPSPTGTGSTYGPNPNRLADTEVADEILVLVVRRFFNTELLNSDLLHKRRDLRTR